MDCYNKSVTYAQRIKNENLRNEFMYLNQSDLGYIYYSVEENKIKLLEIWDECKNIRLTFYLKKHSIFIEKWCKSI